MNLSTPFLWITWDLAMMGRSHAKQGVCAALVLGVGAYTFGFLTLEEPQNLAISAVLLVSGATWADIDAAGSHATKSFGYITRGIHLAVHYLTRLIYESSRTQRDPEKKGAHRLLTHTLLGNLAAGLLLAGIVSLGSIPAAIAVGLLIGMAVAVFHKKLRWSVAIGAGALTYLLPETSPLMWGAAFAIGNAVHCFGDSCTIAGTPWFWPLARDGKRWGNYHLLPASARIRTGSRTEPVLMGLTYAVTVVSIGAMLFAGGVL